MFGLERLAVKSVSEKSSTERNETGSQRQQHNILNYTSVCLVKYVSMLKYDSSLFQELLR